MFNEDWLMQIRVRATDLYNTDVKTNGCAINGPYKIKAQGYKGCLQITVLVRVTKRQDENDPDETYFEYAMSIPEQHMTFKASKS